MTFRTENQLCHCVDAQPGTLETSPPAAELLVWLRCFPSFLLTSLSVLLSCLGVSASRASSRTHTFMSVHNNQDVQL